MADKSYTSVWDAIEDTPEEAMNMKVRSQLMIIIRKKIEKMEGTQADKAEMLGMQQPRLSDLMRGKVDKFAIDALVEIAFKAGLVLSISAVEAA